MSKRSPHHDSDPVEIVRLGKDEMNLIEYPFAALWQKEGKQTILSSEWETRHPINGRTLKACWKVMGHPELGLPTASDERVYLVLMELTREAGFDQQTVLFSRYDLLKRLGWKDDPIRYAMLSDAFKRLQSVKIQADNAFWDGKHKSFRNVGFSLIEVYDILAERPGRKKKEQSELPVSYFTWNDVIFASFQNGFLKTLDLSFALALKGDIALRLYRYLDKKSFDGRRTYDIDLEALCVRHLGMKPSPYASKLKERLKPAHEELSAKGFIEKVEYQPMKTKKGDKVCYTFAPRPGGSLPAADNPGVAQPAGNLHPDEQTAPLDEQTAALDESKNLDNGLLQRMLDLKVSPVVSEELLRTTPREALEKQLDCLNDRKPKDPAAIFVKSCREMWALPEAYVARLEALEGARRAQAAAQAEEVAKAAQKRREAALRASDDEEVSHLDAAYEKLNPLNRKRVDEEATKRLGIVGQLRQSQAALAAMRRHVLREMLEGLKADA